MTANRFFGPSGDGFLNTESFVDILDEYKEGERYGRSNH